MTDGIAAEIATMNLPAPVVTVTWTPHGGSPISVRGDYLSRVGEQITLACGIEQLLDDLDLPQLSADHEIAVAESVTAQLHHSGEATVRCPGGVARLSIPD